MARPRKITPPAWNQGETLEMPNGQPVTRWTNTATGESILIEAGIHPTDQAAAPPTELVDFDEPIEETATDRVATLLQAAQGQERAELNVYRIVQGQREYCRKYSPAEFEEGSFEILRDQFGPGEYELRLYATHPETRKFVIRNSTRIKIAENKNPDAAAPGLPNGLSQVLSTIANGQQQMLNALVEMKQAPQKDPMEEMTKMLSMMTMMREAMGLNKQSTGGSIGEIVGAIKELRGAAAEILPQEKEPDSLMSMLPKVLEMVSAGQQAQLTQQPVMMPEVQMPPGIAQAQPPMQPPAAQQQTDPMQPYQPQQTQDDADMKAITFLKLRGYLKQLVILAETKKTTDEGAKFVYDVLPDELVEIMLLPNWFDLLTMVAPEVKPQEVWLRETREKAVKMFDIQDET
jgi:hypothetical protein